MLLIPMSVALVLLIGGVFWWSVRSGQFDELDTPPLDMLRDEPSEPAPAAAPKAPEA